MPAYVPEGPDLRHRTVRRCYRHLLCTPYPCLESFTSTRPSIWTVTSEQIFYYFRLFTHSASRKLQVNCLKVYTLSGDAVQ